jgi:pseudouridine-5'-phosphate glycosidase
VDEWIADAVAAAERDHVTGGRVTPFVLSHVAQASGGQTLRANVALIVNNARTAARIAVALAERQHRYTG